MNHTSRFSLLTNMGLTFSQFYDEVGYFVRESTAYPPRKATEGSAGYDLRACESVHIRPGQRQWVNTGIGFILPHGTYGRVAGRSHLVANGFDIGAGVIDRDYQGSVKVLVINNSNSEWLIRPGDRIAQIIFEKIVDQGYLSLRGLPKAKTLRGTQGFGSTG